jgi:hypothetical protein
MVKKRCRIAETIHTPRGANPFGSGPSATNSLTAGGSGCVVTRSGRSEGVCRWPREIVRAEACVALPRLIRTGSLDGRTRCKAMRASGDLREAVAEGSSPVHDVHAVEQDRQVIGGRSPSVRWRGTAEGGVAGLSGIRSH